MNFAIIGASGNVGRKTIEILEKSKILFKDLYLVASKKSAGKKIKFREKEIEIENLENYDFSKAQITIFAAGSDIAKDWAPKAAKKTIVIDNSSFFRMQKNIPLVVPEVNPEALDKHENIIANPNCSTMQMVLALKPLHDEYKIKRVIVSTYQAVSGAGKEAMDELFDQTQMFLENYFHPEDGLNKIEEVNSQEEKSEGEKSEEGDESYATVPSIEEKSNLLKKVE